MLIKKQHRDLVHAISQKAQIPEESLSPYISAVMVAFVSGIASPMSNDKGMYTIRVNHNNRWLRSQSDQFINEMLSLHGMLSCKKEFLYGIVITHIQDHMEEAVSSFTAGSENIDNLQIYSKNPIRPSFREFLFEVTEAGFLVPRSTANDVDLINKSMGGITSSIDDATFFRKISSISYDMKERKIVLRPPAALKSAKHSVVSYPQTSPAISLLERITPNLIRSKQCAHQSWQPLLPTLNGLCRYLQGLLAEAFEVRLKISDLQNAIAKAFHSDWNLLKSSEKDCTLQFNVMFATTRHTDVGPQGVLHMPPFEGMVFFLNQARDEGEYDVRWDSPISELSSILGLIPEHGLLHYGLKMTLNVDFFLDDTTREHLFELWDQKGPPFWDRNKTWPPINVEPKKDIAPAPPTIEDSPDKGGFLNVITYEPETGDSTPKWLRSVVFTDDGKIFIPAPFTGESEDSILLMASVSEVDTIIHKNHLFVSLDWADKEFSAERKLYQRIRQRVQEALNGTLNKA